MKTKKNKQTQLTKSCVTIISLALSHENIISKNNKTLHFCSGKFDLAFISKNQGVLTNFFEKGSKT